MHACWAKGLGTCADKISKEHLVSSSILGDIVEVQGLSWCKDTPKRISSRDLTSKILCEKHNNDLWQSDTEVQTFIQTTNTFFNKSRASLLKALNRNKLPIRYFVNGTLLERWFCKTLVNIAFVNEGDAIIPIDRLLPYVFEGKQFERPFGLNFAAKSGLEFVRQPTVFSCAPIFDNSKTNVRVMIGGLAVLRGMRFVFLFPSNKDPLDGNKLALSTEEGWDGMQLNWHNQILNMPLQLRRREVISQEIIFRWNEA